jgi:hypothetical protein
MVLWQEANMVVPPATDPHWAHLVQGKLQVQFEFLAVKVMLGRVLATVRADPSPATVTRNAADVREMFAKNAHLPSMQRDLEKIFR